MNIATIILVYVIAWWMIFFAALPIGIKTQEEAGEDIVKGTVPSAPSNPNLKKKAYYASAIALVFTIGYYFVATSGWISFRPS
ncbi:MAG: DUF1467 family protein [Kordiimonadaceae bacterium]|nr:DUF1467 family protein [Kordiimonadaceae bacterium]